VGRENVKNIKKTNKLCYCLGGKFPPLKALKNKTLCLLSESRTLNLHLKTNNIILLYNAQVVCVLRRNRHNNMSTYS